MTFSYKEKNQDFGNVVHCGHLLPLTEPARLQIEDDVAGARNDVAGARFFHSENLVLMFVLVFKCSLNL